MYLTAICDKRPGEANVSDVAFYVCGRRIALPVKVDMFAPMVAGYWPHTQTLDVELMRVVPFDTAETGRAVIQSEPVDTDKVSA